MNNNMAKDDSSRQDPVIIAYYYYVKDCNTNICIDSLNFINHCFIYPDISQEGLIAVDQLKKNGDHERLINQTSGTDVKVMATIGHDRKYGEDPNKIPGLDYLVQIAENPHDTIKFADYIVNFCTKHRYAGIDLNWETPQKHQAALYECFVRTLNAIFKEKNLLFSITLPGQFEKTYYLNYQELTKNTDWINIMTYDFGNSCEFKITHNAPLPDIKKNVTEFRKHIPANKLVLGLASYGYQYINVEEFKINKCGTREPKRYSVDDIRTNLADSNWIKECDTNENVPFMYNKNSGKLMTYDCPKSLMQKCKYVKQAKLKGVMFWSTYLDSKISSNSYQQIVTNYLKPKDENEAETDPCKDCKAISKEC